jgi:branched-chain amino acid transport system permease protein
MAHLLMDAGISALIAFGLFLPLIGLNAVQDILNELVLETRFPLLAGLVAAVVAGRLFFNLVLAPWRERRGLRHAATRLFRHVAGGVQRSTVYAGSAL